MTNEKFEQLLRYALAPQINDHEVSVLPELLKQKKEIFADNTKTTYITTHEKVRFNSMRIITNIATAAICAALAAGIVTAWKAYLKMQTSNAANSKVTGIISNSEKSFLLKISSEEINSIKSVPLICNKNFEGFVVEGDDTEDGFVCHSAQSSASGFELKTSKPDKNVKYCILANFSCEGDNIEYVTYSINKGTFSVVEVGEKSDSLIKSSILYDGSTDFPRYWKHDFIMQNGGKISTQYYTEYSVDYDSQKNSKFCVNLCCESFDEDIYKKIPTCTQHLKIRSLSRIALCI